MQMGLLRLKSDSDMYSYQPTVCAVGVIIKRTYITKLKCAQLERLVHRIKKNKKLPRIRNQIPVIF